MDIYWIFIIIAVIAAIYFDKIDKKIPKDNFMLLGALIGTIAGLVIMVSVKDAAKFAVSLSICPLAGIFIGMLIKKR